MGQVLQAGQGQIPSRQAQIKGGIPKEVSSETINKVCASGLRASVILDQAIRAGDVQVGVGGGMESMSQAPYLLPGARFGFRMGDVKALDAMVHDGLTNPFSGKQMFVEATEVGRGAGDDPRGPRPLGAALARARVERDRRGAALRGDRAGHGQGSKGRHGRRDRRGSPPGHLAGEARVAAGPCRQGGLAHRRQLPRRQRRRRRAGALLRRVGCRQRQGGSGRDRRPRPERQRLRLPGDHACERRKEGPRESRVCSPATSTCGRSTRRSPRSP